MATTPKPKVYTLTADYNGIPSGTVGVLVDDMVAFTYGNKTVELSLAYLSQFPVKVS
jgi:hypothetical protein